MEFKGRVELRTSDNAIGDLQVTAIPDVRPDCTSRFGFHSSHKHAPYLKGRVITITRSVTIGLNEETGFLNRTQLSFDASSLIMTMYIHRILLARATQFECLLDLRFSGVASCLAIA